MTTTTAARTTDVIFEPGERLYLITGAGVWVSDTRLSAPDWRPITSGCAT